MPTVFAVAAAAVAVAVAVRVSSPQPQSLCLAMGVARFVLPQALLPLPPPGFATINHELFVDNYCTKCSNKNHIHNFEPQLVLSPPINGVRQSP